MSFTIEKLHCEAANEACIKAIHSSGLQIYISEKPDFSVNYAVFGTHYGSVDTEFSLGDEPMQAVPEGIAHFLEHKLFEGEDGDAFEKYAVTGASANAYTSFDRTCYLFSCSERFYENLDILLGFVSSPYFTPETVSKEQGIIGQEIRMYEDVPGWRVLFNLLRIMYRNHPVRIEIAGTVESIAEITDKTLYDCYRTFYNPSNMFLCLCGNIDSEKVLKAVEEKIKATEVPEIHRSEFSEPDTLVDTYCEQIMPVAQPLFVMGIKDNRLKLNRTLKDIIANKLLLEVTAGKLSPLYNKLLNDGLINNSFGTEFFFGHGYSALLFEGESKDPEAVKKAVLSELAAIAENGVDPELFEDARRQAYGVEIRSFNDTEETVDGFIDCAMNGFAPFETLDVLKSLTADDITKSAKALDLSLTALSVIKS